MTHIHVVNVCKYFLSVSEHDVRTAIVHSINTVSGVAERWVVEISLFCMWKSIDTRGIVIEAVVHKNASSQNEKCLETKPKSESSTTSNLGNNRIQGADLNNEQAPKVMFFHIW